MTDSKIQSAKKLLAAGTPPREVAKNLGVSLPTLTLYRCRGAVRTDLDPCVTGQRYDAAAHAREVSQLSIQAGCGGREKKEL